MTPKDSNSLFKTSDKADFLDCLDASIDDYLPREPNPLELPSPVLRALCSGIRAALCFCTLIDLTVNKPTTTLPESELTVLLVEAWVSNQAEFLVWASLDMDTVMREHNAMNAEFDAFIHITAVMDRLSIPANFSELDRDIVVRAIKKCGVEGWSIDDTLAYCRCFEEVNPSLDEAVALQRMAKLEAKYTMDTCQKFENLVNQWHKETGGLSDVHKRLANNNYRAIIDLGWPVVPILIQELKSDDPEMWGPALREITGESVVIDPSDYGSLNVTAEKWIELATTRGWVEM